MTERNKTRIERNGSLSHPNPQNDIIKLFFALYLPISYRPLRYSVYGLEFWFTAVMSSLPCKHARRYKKIGKTIAISIERLPSRIHYGWPDTDTPEMRRLASEANSDLDNAPYMAVCAGLVESNAEALQPIQFTHHIWHICSLRTRNLISLGWNNVTGF